MLSADNSLAGDTLGVGSLNNTGDSKFAGTAVGSSKEICSSDVCSLTVGESIGLSLNVKSSEVEGSVSALEAWKSSAEVWIGSGVTGIGVTAIGGADIGGAGAKLEGAVEVAPPSKLLRSMPSLAMPALAAAKLLTSDRSGAAPPIESGSLASGSAGGSISPDMIRAKYVRISRSMTRLSGPVPGMTRQSIEFSSARRLASGEICGSVIAFPRGLFERVASQSHAL